ncbi:hypothetical protein BFN03_18920 [Rhodococcus sp. WMMA185]|nr:hypothetical protein BFN03_18920 [Rhodococcus sp. WMMA185]
MTFKPADVVPPDTVGSVSCMRTKNVQEHLDLSDVWAIDTVHVKRVEQYLKKGDLLVSSANSWNLVGKCSWVPELERRSTFGGFVTVLRPNEDKVDPRFLYRFFSSDRTQATARSFSRQTTNISNLDLKRCAAMPILLPPLAEQRRIAAILDHADALRAKRREALARLDELTQSIFVEMFGEPSTNPRGWPVQTMDELCMGNFRNGLSPSSRGTVHANVLTLSAVTGTEFDSTAVKVATFKTTPPPEQSVDERDLLICRGNGNLNLVGKGYFAPRSLPDTTFPDTIIAARVDATSCSRAYIQALWNTRAVRMQLESAARTTNGTYKINQGSLGSIKLPIPPSEHQTQFAGRIAGIEGLRKGHRQALSALDALFASLQSRAFRGEL